MHRTQSDTKYIPIFRMHRTQYKSGYIQQKCTKTSDKSQTTPENLRQISDNTSNKAILIEPFWPIGLSGVEKSQTNPEFEKKNLRQISDKPQQTSTFLFAISFLLADLVSENLRQISDRFQTNFRQSLGKEILVVLFWSVGLSGVGESQTNFRQTSDVFLLVMT